MARRGGRTVRRPRIKGLQTDGIVKWIDVANGDDAGPSVEGRGHRREDDLRLR
jgi:hypothetical protein